MLTAISETRNSKTLNALASATKREITKISPAGQFVIKTKIFTPYRGSLPGTKLFINVCTSDLVPLPPALKPGLVDPKDDVFDPNLIFPMIMENQWEIPILTSPELRDDRDKKGNHSLVIDCVIHNKPMKWCLVNNDLKMILIEWCFDAVEFKISRNLDDFIIDRQTMSLPKRAYMGELQDMEIDLVQMANENKELKELSEKLERGGDNDPSSILLAKRAVDEEESMMDLDVDSNKLPDLLGISNSTGIGKRPLIEEISDMRISPEPESSSKRIVEVHNEIKLKKLSFVLTVKKLTESDTRDNYKLLIQIDSELRSGDDYLVRYNTKTNSILITTRKDAVYDVVRSTVEFPLPEYIKGDQIKVFYVDNDRQMNIFIK